MGIMQLRVVDYAINLECRFSQYDNLVEMSTEV